ncbi:MAG: MaoC family dehydratase N-terminal domain-containing protein, partial [Bauldia litoralis]
FAGAKTTYHRPLRAGDEIRREGVIESIVEKQGRTGPLVFVKTVLKIHGEDGEHAVTEEQDVVYRELDTSGQTPPPVPSEISEPEWRRTISPSPVMLFRYSALTFNNHRIHYDQPYTTQEEGYPGLLVHGPLIATCLAELVRDSAPDRTVHSFAYRAMSPLYATSDFELVGAMDPGGEGCRVEAIGPDGGVAMAATVAFK